MDQPQSARLEQLFQFLEASPEDPFLLFAIAKEYENLNAKEKTLEYYLLLKKSSPDYVGLYYHLGKFYEAAADWDKALAAYDEGIKVAKAQNDRHALSELAGARMEIAEED